MSQVLSPAQLKQIAEDKERQQLEEALAQKKARESAEREMHDAFFADASIPADAIDRLNRLIRNTVEQGKSEALVFRFPAVYCSDHGRAINNFDSEWHDSLQGRAKRAYDFFKSELEPQGYKLRAQILDYPDGNLGDVGFFLRW